MGPFFSRKSWTPGSFPPALMTGVPVTVAAYPGTSPYHSYPYQPAVFPAPSPAVFMTPLPAPSPAVFMTPLPAPSPAVFMTPLPALPALPAPVAVQPSVVQYTPATTTYVVSSPQPFVPSPIIADPIPASWAPAPPHSRSPPRRPQPLSGGSPSAGGAENALALAIPVQQYRQARASSPSNFTVNIVMTPYQQPSQLPTNAAVLGPPPSPPRSPAPQLFVQGSPDTNPRPLSPPQLLSPLCGSVHVVAHSCGCSPKIQ
ncbi:hypothetical protein BC827DRAFT_1156926 [Russula dissimulans]|nr:hypothetical protein BC827DRAFT_1156926 [Russula dissimulans]